ncbi:cellulose biosynthesis cyclic di-GMP-binding regulatory protein BcsB [Clostridium oryzae]|uniref:Cellulose synthase regulator protein n=1 Tax=Clostridium oryzae TaxID=1450648 RepID=A0A1V4IE93_9CLOT|nr:cellulose biosynthesis cyclic di-GMP-binding regulatory protein BcsB [Clostridium oryzae]OPJ58273.1 cellulose synthase regulator protein [Clostridium oryzae]
MIKVKKALMAILIVFLSIGMMFFQKSLKTYAVDKKVHAYSNSIITKNYSFNKNINFKGVFGEDRIYFKVDKYWKVKKISLSLNLTQSKIINEKLSTLTVYLNGKPVHSIKLSKYDEEENDVRFNLNTHYLKKGTNELEIQSYRRISDEKCEDNINNANWILIKSSSYLHLEFSERKPSDSISEYPYPFVKTSEKAVGQNTVILLPNNPDENEIAAALLISASLGENIDNEKIDTDIVKYSDFNKKLRKNKNIIFIGKSADIPREINEVISKFKQKDKLKGVFVFRADSPYNSNNKIMGIVANRNDDILINAAKFFQNSNLFGQVDSNSYVINGKLNVNNKATSIKNKRTFSDLGYSDGVYMKGPNKQEAIIGISIPNNKSVRQGAMINLKFRYSKNLDFTRSLVSVYVNDTPIGSKKLERKDGNDDSLNLNVSSNVFKGSYAELKIVFNLQMEDLKCTVNRGETPWAFIKKDSAIYLPTKDNNSIVFENYPWPFIKDERFNDVTIVIADNERQQNMKILSDMFAFLGSYIKDNRGKVTVIKASSFSKKNNNGNIILVGSPKENKIIKLINKNMFFKYSKELDYFLSNEKRTLLMHFSKNLASAQLIPSSFNKQRNILVITAPKQEHIPNVSRYFTDFVYNSKIIGNATLVNRWGDKTNHYFILKSSKSSALIKKINFSGTSIKMFIIACGAIIIMLIFSMLMYMKKYKRNGSYAKNKPYRRYRRSK